MITSLVENEQAFLGCSHLEENIYIPPMFFGSKSVNLSLMTIKKVESVSQT